MKAEIVATGTELLLGEIVDSNSPFLAQQLSRLGIDLFWVSTVGDNLRRLIEVLQRAWERSDFIITTGGLGPTQGDITRDALAAMLGEHLTVDEAEKARLETFFRSRGLEMPESNIRQATRIPSSQFLSNPLGTAPGWWVERDGRIIVTLPGPPEELQQLWRNECAPRLQERQSSGIILTRVLKIFGISEARLGELVSGLAARSNPTVATYVKQDGIHLRIAAKAMTEQTARDMAVDVEQQVRAIVGKSVWGADDETLPAAIGVLLREKGLTLAAMESCTGGLLAGAITAVPGSSDYFAGGVVSYTNRVKTLCGVPSDLIRRHGSVSEPVARSMAEAVRKKMKSDIGVSITGVAGPSALEGKAPGTVFVGIDDGTDQRVISRTLPGNRQRVRDRAVTMALFEMRKTLLDR
ncbi:MAG: competence/damage-inducible protein A [Chloroflexi bacterium]|nr:competence/damage-inducible protein A [Chloroflexota bacterium]